MLIPTRNKYAEKISEETIGRVRVCEAVGRPSFDGDVTGVGGSVVDANT